MSVHNDPFEELRLKLGRGELSEPEYATARRRLIDDQPSVDRKGLITVAALFFGIVTVFGVIGLSERKGTDLSDGRNTPGEARSALDTMTIVFKGGYTRAQIEQEASEILRLFDQPLTDTSYMDLADVLVTMRKGIEPSTEMDIMRCMKAMKQRAYDVKLVIPDTAALCATSLELGIN